MRRGASGASRHVTAKPSIGDWDVLGKSGVYARTVSCLTPGGLPGASEIEAGRWVTGAEYRGEVSRGHSRRKAGEVSEGLQAEKGGATDRPSRNAGARRPERFPESGLKERSTWLLKERRHGVRRAQGREPYGWDEVAVGAVAGEAPVERRGACGTSSCHVA